MTKNEKILAALAICSIAGMVVVAVLALTGALSQPDALKVRALEVVDEAGRTRAMIAVSEEGITGLTLYDQAHRARFAVVLGPDGTPQVAGMDDQGKPIWGNLTPTTQSLASGD